MGALFDRLALHEEGGALAGELRDGPRRYLLMRPDVLMGTFARLAPEARQAALEALAESAEANAADSLRAYLAALGGDRRALLDTTAASAADLGWGRWSVRVESGGATLEVENSPFASGWPVGLLADEAAGRPVCAPIRGLLAALATLALDAPVACREVACRALGAPRCRFEAFPRPS